MKSKEDSKNQVVEEVIESLQEEEGYILEFENKIRQRKVQFWKIVMICVLVVILIGMGLFYYLKHCTYNQVYVTETYEIKKVDNSNCIEFVGGIVRYGKDGAMLLNKKGEEIWNCPYEMQNPIVEIRKGTMVIGDKGGTSIVVLQKDGKKGEIHTTRPIERVTVSEQGIVGAILKNEAAPLVMCYDLQGSILVEQKASLTNTGYPIDVAVSNDGTMLLVSYLYVKGNAVTTQIVYYDFGGKDGKKKDYKVAEGEYVNTVVPTVLFFDNYVSAAVGNGELLFYKGKDAPRLFQKIEIKKEIKSVAYDESGIAMILKNPGKTGSQLCLYNTKGKEVMSVDFEGEYTHMKLSGDKIILFDGNKCSIYNKAGIHKYEGELEMNVMEIIPIMGVDKYLVIGTDELQEIQLTK